MVVLIDVDNVMNNFSETLLAWHNRAAVNQKDIHTIEEVDNYDWFTDTYGDDAWKPTEYKEFWDDVEINPDMARIALEINNNDNFHVYFVTASHYNDMLSYKIRTTIEKINQFSWYLPEYNFCEQDVIVCHDKNLVNGDILIDDCYDNCISFSEADKRHVSILWKKPWNLKELRNSTKEPSSRRIAVLSVQHIAGIIFGVNAVTECEGG